MGNGLADVLEPSAFREGDYSMDRITANDQVILRAFYDRRIKPPMAVDEIAKIAGPVIDDAVWEMTHGAARRLCRPMARPAVPWLRPVLRRLFVETVFIGGRDRHAKSRIFKWMSPVVVTAFDAPSWFREEFATVAHRLECATGLQIRLKSETATDSNFRIYFGRRSFASASSIAYDAGRSIARASLDDQWLRGCKLQYDIDTATSEIVGASLEILADPPDGYGEECLRRYMVQGLGLTAAHDLVRESLLQLEDRSIGWPRSDKLLGYVPDTDLLLLRMLYDDRLPTGLPRSSAEQRLDDIVAAATTELIQVRRPHR